VRSTAAPYTESRLTRSVANERVGVPVVEQSKLFALGKSWDNVRSTAAPYTESRLTRSVANERVGFPVVEHCDTQLS
jgi:hypothetical protein